MASHSKCPPHYSRPRVVLLHSPAARSSSTRDLSTYLGAHLARGGYTECDVAPWTDGAAADDCGLDALSVKELKAYLADRGARVPAGAVERADLLAAARNAKGSPARARAVRVLPHNSGRAEPYLVYDCDLRVSSSSEAAAAAVGKASMVLVIVDAEDAKACGKFVATALRNNTTNKDCIPVVLLSPDVMAYSALDSSFGEEAKPLPKAKTGAGPVESAADGAEAEPRKLEGKAVLVDGAVGFHCGARADGCLGCTTRGGLTLERLDAEREKVLSKFYDLLASSEVPLEFRARSNLTVSTWGALLLNAPLLAATSVSSAPDKALLSQLRTREIRLVVAGALREARIALETSAATARQRSMAKRDEEAAQGGFAGAMAAAKKRDLELWAPLISASVRSPLSVCASFRVLEWVLCLPTFLFAWLGAAWVLGVPAGVVSSVASDVAAGRPTKIANQIDELIAACDRAGKVDASVPRPVALTALRDALRDARVRRELATPQALYDRAGRPSASTRDALRFFFKIVAAFAILLFFCILLELLFPSRSRAAMELVSGPDEL